jgi:hypothetical protein
MALLFPETMTALAIAADLHALLAMIAKFGRHGCICSNHYLVT